MPYVTEPPDSEPQPALTDDPALPAWRRHTEGEQRWWVALSMLLAVVLQTLLPSRFSVQPRYLPQAIELVALVALVISFPSRMSRRNAKVRAFTQLVLGLVALNNGISVVLLVHQITSGGRLPAVELLLGGAAIWFTNVIVFGLWFWELDRGGPARRAAGDERNPDFLYPQMTSPESAPAEWRPAFVDYLYVAFTNATAFSPTDTMPLTPLSKTLMSVESLVSLITVVVVAARAVNILKG